MKTTILIKKLYYLIVDYFILVRVLYNFYHVKYKMYKL